MAQIVEDYVSFETAKLLKERGFNEVCNSYYVTGGINNKGEITTNFHNYGETFAINFNDYTNELYSYLEYYSAPTLQMACRWLTAVHNLFIAFELDFSDGAYPMFDAVIYNLATCEKYPIINYDRYSSIKGTEAAIKYCLINLIK